MSLYRILRGLLLIGVIVPIINPSILRAQEGCAANDAHDTVHSYERAALQAQGQMWAEANRTGDTADVLASYERASLQAHGQTMVDVNLGRDDVSLALEAYDRAGIQAQGQVMAQIEPGASACRFGNPLA